MNKNIAKEGRKGGLARAKALTKKQRREGAIVAATARWTRHKILKALDDARLKEEIDKQRINPI